MGYKNLNDSLEPFSVQPLMTKNQLQPTEIQYLNTSCLKDQNINVLKERIIFDAAKPEPVK